MTQRVDYMKQSPELFKKFVQFNTAVKEGAIEESIRELVAIRASQINGCGFCLDMHIKQAKIHGERELRLYHVAHGESQRCLSRANEPLWHGPRC